MAEQQVQTVLGSIRVQVSRSGPAMLFWPSLLMTGDMWLSQAEHFSRSYQVILVGNSWGGMIGGTFAALHPSRVSSAVLMNCTGSPAGRRQRLEYGALLRAAKLLGGIRPPLTRSALKAFLGPTTFRTRPDVVANVRQSVESIDISSGSWAVKSVVPLRPDQLELFATISAPVLVVAGAEDATFPVLETRAMADAIPGSRFVVLDGVAHLAALEDPELVNTLIDEFVSASV
jgi:3-oxoadipate enol-lactonase